MCIQLKYIYTNTKINAYMIYQYTIIPKILRSVLRKIFDHTLINTIYTLI